MKKTLIRITEDEFKGIVNEIVTEYWQQVTGTPMSERETPPSVTITVYKQVAITPQTKKTGMVYPLYVDANNGWKIGQWYNAGIGDYKIEIDDETGEPTGKVKVKSKLGGLAFRPGLHFGTVPYAPHIYTQKPNFEDEKLPQNLDSKGKLKKDYDFSQTRYQTQNNVWAECEISFDKDYTPEVRKNGEYVNSKGKTVFNPRNAYMKSLPIDNDGVAGAYEFKTNSNAPSWETWYIAGAFKINRILSDEEVKDICAQHNVKSLDRETILDLSEYFPD